jgi:hypothetical protein
MSNILGGCKSKHSSRMETNDGGRERSHSQTGNNGKSRDERVSNNQNRCNSPRKNTSKLRDERQEHSYRMENQRYDYDQDRRYNQKHEEEKVQGEHILELLAIKELCSMIEDMNMMVILDNSRSRRVDNAASRRMGKVLM